MPAVAAVVSSEGAAVADAFATAFAVAPKEKWRTLATSAAGMPGSQVHLWKENKLAFKHPC